MHPFHGCDFIVTTLPRKQVFKDKDLGSHCFVLPVNTRQCLLSSLWEDIGFLEKCGMLDYSLLIFEHNLGTNDPSVLSQVDPSAGCHFTRDGMTFLVGGCPHGTKIFIIGLIDCLTEFTLAKKTANAFKRIRWRQETLSTIEPGMYAARLKNYCSKIFTSSP